MRPGLREGGGLLLTEVSFPQAHRPFFPFWLSPPKDYSGLSGLDRQRKNFCAWSTRIC